MYSAISKEYFHSITPCIILVLNLANSNKINSGPVNPLKGSVSRQVYTSSPEPLKLGGFMEIWKDVVGYEGYYQVSDHEQIRSLDRYVKHSLGGKRLFKGKLLNQCLDKNGYCIVILCKDGKPRNKKMHRMIGEVFVPNPNNYPCINHKNFIKSDNSPPNLEWCTYSHNNKHAVDAGVLKPHLNCKKGERHPMAKLTNKMVVEIKKRIPNGEKNVNIAKEYNTTRQNISKIRNGRIWKNIKI